MKHLIIPLLAASIGCSSLAYRPSEAIGATSAHALYAHAAQEELLIVNGNAYLMPLSSTHKKRRLEDMAKYISSLPHNPDILTFQEVWSSTYVQRIAELFPGYSVHTSGHERKILGRRFNASGLVTLIKDDIPVLDKDYTHIPARMLPLDNKLLGKGCLSVVIEHKGHRYRINNVHLPNTHKDLKLANTQRSLDALDIEGIIAGDLNLEPHELPSWFHVDDETPTFKNDGVGGERNRRIDYIYGNGTAQVESVVITDAKGVCLPFSDHCFLAAKLTPKEREKTHIAHNQQKKP